MQKETSLNRLQAPIKKVKEYTLETEQDQKIEKLIELREQFNKKVSKELREEIPALKQQLKEMIDEL